MRCTIRQASLFVLLLALAHPRFASSDPQNHPLCTAPSDQKLEDMAPDGQGGGLAVWVDRRTGSDLDVYARRVTATGKPADGWPTDGAPACVAPEDQTAPRIAADGWGGAFVVWQDGRGPDRDIRIQHLDPFGRVATGWPSDGIVVCGASGVQSEPGVVADSRGGAFIVWADSREPITTDIYMHHVDASGTLEPLWPPDGAPLCAADGPQRAPDVAEDGSGGVFVVWEDARSGQSDIWAQRVPADLRAHFWGANGMPVCSVAGEQEWPQVVADGAGGAYFVWQDLRGSYYDVYAQHMLEEGYYDWGWMDGGSAVCAAPGGQLAPQITTDGAGGALVTWFDSRAGTNFDIYAMRLTAHAPASPGWPLGGVALCQASGDQLYPRIAADGEGGAFVTWTDQRTSLVGDIYVQRVASIGVRPACWPAEGLPVCALATSQESPIVVANGRGRALVAWTDGRNGPGTDIYAAALPATGDEVPAIPNGVLAVAATGEQLPSSSPSTVPLPDGEGGAFVAWEDTRGGAFEVYVVRLGLDGRASPGWPAGGVALGVVPGSRTAPVLAADGAGGLFVAWHEDRGGPSDFDIYVQHLRSTGAIASGWPPGGVPACTAPGMQLFPSSSASASGGVFLAWEDYRNGLSSDVYATHIGPGGVRVTGWPENGVAVCTDVRDQQQVAVVGSADWMLLFWSDARSGSRDVYGIGLDSGGGLESNWGYGGTPLCRAAGNQHKVVAIPDGANGAFLCWLDERSGAAAPYAMRVSRTGNRPPGWTENGTPVAVLAPGEERAEQLRVAPDAAGGVLMAWSVRLDQTYDVRVQRLQDDAGRAPGWPASGATVAATSWVRLFPALAPDAAGGAMVAWVDLRAGAPDVYAQHLTAAGAIDPAWNANGIPVCAATGPQWAAGIVATPGCGSLVTWHDERGGDADLYATRVAPIPGTTDAANDAASALVLGVAPNPFRALTRIQLPSAASGRMEVDIYDVAGRRVRRLLVAATGVGAAQIVWDGRGENDVPLAAGTYIVRLRGPGVDARAKLVRCP